MTKIPAAGKAWDAVLQPDQNGRGIILQYFSNEACVQNLAFRYVKRKWMLVEFSEACD